ncbi:MAG: carboxypeptidase-like regulatory domain-containing protein, partial [Bacteroidota bacterium]
MNTKLLLGSICLILFCLSAPTLIAQTTLSGSISDKSTGEPLAFVYVILKNNQQKGVLSNDLGQFSISLSSKDLSDTLILSLLGYKAELIPLSDIDADNPPQLDLTMQTAFVALDEIVVKANLDPRRVIVNAINAIPKNYGVTQYMLKGYYREYGIVDGEYASITEAMITIEDGFYSSPKRRSKIYLDEMRYSDFYGNT